MLISQVSCYTMLTLMYKQRNDLSLSKVFLSSVLS